LGEGRNDHGPLRICARFIIMYAAKRRRTYTALAAGAYHTTMSKNGTLWATGYPIVASLEITPRSSVIPGAGCHPRLHGSAAFIIVCSSKRMALSGVGSNDQVNWAEMGPLQSTAPFISPIQIVVWSTGEIYPCFCSQTRRYALGGGEQQFGQLGYRHCVYDGIRQLAGNVSKMAAGSNDSVWLALDGTLWAIGENSFRPSWQWFGPFRFPLPVSIAYGV